MSLYWQQLPDHLLADVVNTWNLHRELSAEVEDDGFYLRRTAGNVEYLLTEKLDQLAQCLQTPVKDPWEPGLIDPQLSGLFGVFLAARSAAKSAPHLPASHEVFERAVDDLAGELSEMGCQYW